MTSAREPKGTVSKPRRPNSERIPPVSAKFRRHPSVKKETVGIRVGVGGVERIAYLACFAAPASRVSAKGGSGLIAREGYGTILLCAAVVVLVGGALVWFARPLLWPVVVIAAALLIFVVSFFRDPKRMPPDDPSGLVVLAPADGRVIEVAEEYDDIYSHTTAKRVSIFLSPLNVHVNRVPVSGRVEFVRYVPGEYLVAWHPKSSTLNERSEIGVRHESGAPVLFKQIAGAVARRVVFHLREGDVVTAGDRFGIVKFGSRMDVLLPLESRVDVEVNQRVVGGESILGWLPGGER